MEKTRLVIAGEAYNISTDNDLEYTAGLARELNDKIMDLVKSNSRVSVTQAAVLTALDYADNFKKSEMTCENLRTQIRDYLEDAAKSRSEAEIARREVERLNSELEKYRNKK